MPKRNFQRLLRHEGSTPAERREGGGERKRERREEGE